MLRRHFARSYASSSLSSYCLSASKNHKCHPIKKHILTSSYETGHNAFFNSNTRNLSVCVVGSGPAGFYTAKQLLGKECQSIFGNEPVNITIIERLPTPYGLVRYGVAPDHPEVKNVQNDFDQVASDPRVQFIGNVSLGKDVRLKELQELFDVVVLSYGAESERTLGIKGEDLQGVESAREFVAWYNGLPSHTKEHTAEKFKNLVQSSKNAVIIGQGNVALDVARILARPVSTLKPYDVTSQAMHVLENFNSNLKHILVVGRRGPVQIAATTKELRELIKLNCLYADPTQIQDEYLDEISKEQLHKEGRVKQRLIQLLQTAVVKPSLPDNTKLVELVFFRSPVEFLPKKDDPSRIGSIKFEITKLEKDPNGDLEPKAVGTGIFEEIECDLVFKSIGYKSVNVDPEIPFDLKKGVVVNEHGRVVNPQTKHSIGGVYVCGWLKRGPSGVILSNIYDAEETVESITNDFSSGALSRSKNDAHTKLVSKLQEKNISYVNFGQYKKLEQFEVNEGQKMGKIREKVLHVPEMLNICFK
ncbi:hypothetical protein C9374_009057 [Naegleria lovaniensis]|uniref:NADPH:adrenodoxin oxidoreductase, mitochondrial n=1 Tax=Naegleria lovaniensis TaxID=51637 RepID=A0AA88GJB9_NAELO|nr:uncharacterized protein C9374_009057 [Naegleria lovaniensis]KAG2377541.1 hypothetical protein C9374_009057 [Naegleria lovaniensis]